MRPLLAVLAALLLCAAPASAGVWLSGDLHVHTTYSHDVWGGPSDDNTPIEELYTFGNTVEDVFTVAALRGMDFLAVTDHNDVRSVSDPGFGSDTVIGVPAYENSLPGGPHAQMLGANRIYDKANVRAMQEELEKAGGVLQANHPTDPAWTTPYKDVPVSTVEVWNLPWFYQPPFPSAADNDAAVEFGVRWLDQGAHVGFTGGSDSHWKATVAGQGPGQPTTWVYAADRSLRGILEGLREGRTSISWQPPGLGGPRVFLEGQVDGLWSAMPGDTVKPDTPLRVRVQGAPGATLEVRFDTGLPAQVVTVASQDFTHALTAPAGATFAFAKVFAGDGYEQRPDICAGIPVLELDGQTTYCSNRLGMLALSSAIYLAPPRVPPPS